MEQTYQHLVEELRRLQLLEATEEPDPAALAEILVSLPPCRENARLLQSIAVSAPRKLAKVAKRLLYLWGNKGVPLTDAASPAQAWRLKTGPILHEALLSHIDGEGGRMVVCSLGQPSRPYIVMVVIANDIKGLQQAEVYEPTNKRDYRAVMEALPPIEDIPCVKADPVYCRAWLKHYHRLNREGRLPVPREFEVYRSILGPEEPLPPPLILGLLPDDELPSSRIPLLSESLELFGEPEMAAWRLERPLVDQALEQLETRQSSSLVLSTGARQIMIEEIKRQLLAGIFIPEFRAVYSRRLEEMAFFFWETGRQSLARIAVALAQATREKEELMAIPFFRKLADQTMAPEGTENRKTDNLNLQRGLYVPRSARRRQ